MSKSPLRVAVVLAGAGAKGAYEAAALRVLARSNVQIVRIVATSSGALNGVVLAAAARARALATGTEQLVELWSDHAGWTQVFRPRWRLLRTRRGVSDSAKLIKMLRAQVQALPSGKDINLRLLVAPLAGVTRAIGRRPASSYEAVRDFDGSDFATSEALEKVFVAAAASAAFPLVFGPVEVGDLGPCIDGGAVNNTPIGHALDGPIGRDVDLIVVISTTPELRPPSPEPQGIALAAHLGSMLIDERLFRDLREAAATNDALRRLAALVETSVIDRHQLERVMAALGWTGRRLVNVIQIRPTEELPGSVFSGFFESALRTQYLVAGARRAHEVLDPLDL